MGHSYKAIQKIFIWGTSKSGVNLPLNQMGNCCIPLSLILCLSTENKSHFTQWILLSESWFAASVSETSNENSCYSFIENLVLRVNWFDKV